MNIIKLPIQNSIDVLVGDIYVSCHISFNTQMPPQTTERRVTLDKLNSRLNELGYKIAAEISHRVVKELGDSND